MKPCYLWGWTAGPREAFKTQERVQGKNAESKKRSLKSVTLAVKGGWKASGDQWWGMGLLSHTGAAQWGVGS